jgi:putative ABC transport system ATP-binding protein
MIRPAAIEVDRLSLAFGPRTVLRDFSMRVEDGETIVLAGPSGCGKSSVLACVLGFAVPSAGGIRICGAPLDPASAWRLRRSMALVQQEPDLGERTAQEWLEEPFAFAANARLRASLDKLPDILARLRLQPAILGQKGPQLSGGEKQRIALVSALLLDRPILLLDEPASALDSDSRRAVHDCLASLKDTTLLMVSHDDATSLRFADRIVQLAPAPEEVPHGRD